MATHPLLRVAGLSVLFGAGCLPLSESSMAPATPEAGVPVSDGRPLPTDAPFRFKGASFTDLVQHSDARIGSDMDPDLSPDGKWLTFCSTRHEAEPEIYVQSVSGHAAVRKTFHQATDCCPVFSPDGNRIAFCSNRHGDFDLFVMSVNGREAPMALTQGDGDEMHPSWSPDGSKIVYCAYDRKLADWELRVVDVATGSKTYLGISGLYPKWSPDGKHLVFQRARERGDHWYAVWTVEISCAPGRVGAEVMSPAEIVANPVWAAITPAWSKDGRYLIFVTTQAVPGRDGARQDLWMAAVDGSRMIQLTPPSMTALSPCWGGDDRVYFVSDRNGGRCIWSLKPMALEEIRPGGP